MHNDNIIISYDPSLKKIDDQKIEIVERKGLGHPDTISDDIAENISVEYSKYCLDHFNLILRHMVDKISVTGGRTKVTFGGGKVVAPAKIHLKGRFTASVGAHAIPYLEISTKAINLILSRVYSDYNTSLISIENQIYFAPGPGAIFTPELESRSERKNFFIDQDIASLAGHDNQGRANDTSTAVCYFPLSTLESIVIEIERYLNSIDYKRVHPYVGTDIKIMGKRVENDIEITACIPLISKYVNSFEDYSQKLKNIETDLRTHLGRKGLRADFSLSMNTRDNIGNDDLYMTLLGSALESGDEGAVGRGNRVHGVIPFARHFSMEAACGKNPVYHVGKIYTALAYLISEYIYTTFGVENYTMITSQNGKNLDEPWLLSITLQSEIDEDAKDNIRSFVMNRLANLSDVTLLIINKKIPLYY